MKRTVERSRTIENTSLTSLLLVLVVLLLAPAAHAGIADSPVPKLQGQNAVHVYSVPYFNHSSAFGVSFQCTSTDTSPIIVGVELWDQNGSLLNDASATSVTVQPGATEDWGHPPPLALVLLATWAVASRPAPRAFLLPRKRSFVPPSFGTILEGYRTG